MSRLIFGRVLIPAAAVITESQIDKNDKTCKPSELPIYTPQQPAFKQTEIETTNEPGMIENAIKTTRETVSKYTEEIKAYERVGLQYFHDSKTNVEWVVNYLQEEDNTTPKAGAIGIGALAGLIFGLRGGLFKRTLYATAGALGMASVCYPKEAAEYSQLGIVEAKKYLTIGYNFVYGDEPVQIQKAPVQEQEVHIDPLAVITDSFKDAESKSCHCPIGSCLGQHEENPPPTVESPPPNYTPENNADGDTTPTPDNK